jgi:hypothetical protein
MQHEVAYTELMLTKCPDPSAVEIAAVHAYHDLMHAMQRMADADDDLLAVEKRCVTTGNALQVCNNVVGALVATQQDHTPRFADLAKKTDAAAATFVKMVTEELPLAKARVETTHAAVRTAQAGALALVRRAPRFFALSP